MPPTRRIRLTSAEDTALRALYRSTDNADVRSRCLMILLSAQGHGVAEIARLTFFDQDTVLFWFDRYEADGLAGLQDRPRSGRPPKVTGASRDELEQAADQDPRQAGHPFSVWTCRDLAHYLAQRGHLRVTAETIRRHLRSLGFRIVRPVLSISSPDPDYEAKVAHLEELKVKARCGEIILLHEDEFDLNLLPGIIGCWTRRGQQRRIPTPGQNQKRYGFGATNFITGRSLDTSVIGRTATTSAPWWNWLCSSTAQARRGKVRRLSWSLITTSSIAARRPLRCWRAMPTASLLWHCRPIRPS